MTDRDLKEFLHLFEVYLQGESRRPSRHNPMPMITGYKDSYTAIEAVQTEQAYDLNIGEKQLAKLIRILKYKGFYHDEDYAIRMREEELIMNHPELKRLHDEYKMLLCLLSSDQWSIQ
jgi:hypothetical protein